MIDLQQFCSKDEARFYIQSPFSFGDFTYATNGHIIVRVLRRIDAPEGHKPITSDGMASVLRCHEGAKFSALPPVFIPPPLKKECKWCDGAGWEDEDDKCFECGGTGKQLAKRSVEVRGAIFDANYIAQIIALPSAEFTTSPMDGRSMSLSCEPSPFIFDGGIGSLMPTRNTLDFHLGKIEDMK